MKDFRLSIKQCNCIVLNVEKIDQVKTWKFQRQDMK